MLKSELEMATQYVIGDDIPYMLKENGGVHVRRKLEPCSVAFREPTWESGPIENKHGSNKFALSVH